MPRRGGLILISAGPYSPCDEVPTNATRWQRPVLGMAKADAEAMNQAARPAILALGFRVFFLGAGAWAAAAMIVWLLTLEGGVSLPTALDPLTWHTHELLFGFVAAAISGFMLTAIPNWTTRLPVRGLPLALLFLLWLAGRAAVAVSVPIGAPIAAAIDVAYLATLFVVVAREIMIPRHWRNLPVAGLVGLLAIANLLVHLEVLGAVETGALGFRLGMATVVFLITLIGGRIVPSFTLNWLRKQRDDALSAPFGMIDRIALAATALAGVAWVAAPDTRLSGALSLLAALANAVRLARWHGHRTLSEPLLWVLHLAYAWLAAGLALLGVSALVPDIPQTTALHALTAGAIPMMILAVMTRAILGHSGRALTAGHGTTAIYGAVSLAALLRIASPLLGTAETAAIIVAGALWAAGFLTFLGLYGPIMVKRRSRAAA